MADTVRNSTTCGPVPGAGGVPEARSRHHGTGGGATPTPALLLPVIGPKDLKVGPIGGSLARPICVSRHYLHSYPGGSLLHFGVFAGTSLLGVAVIGAGPANVKRFFRGAQVGDVACLTRLWLDDRLGRNAESRVLGIILRSLRRKQATIKALVAYSDPAAGHTGIIYRAAGFFYLGRSQGMPLYRLADGRLCHSRTLSQLFGTRDRNYFARAGVPLELVRQAPKHTYVALIAREWTDRLTRVPQPYPKGEA